MLPITRVVVMEDRAQVERSGAVPVTSGRQQLVVPAVALVAVDRSLRAEVRGATLVDARLERRWRSKPPGGLPADASALRRRVDTLEKELLARRDTSARLQLRGELLEAARADLLRSIAEGAAHGAASGDWAERLGAVTSRQGEHDEALRVARREEHYTQLRLNEARAALQAAEQPISDLECALVLTVEAAEAGTAQIRLSYLVPCAVWRPAYRATLSGEAVRLEAEAVVWQNTGEPWNEVALAFSTARPTLGTSPPVLVDDRLSTRPKQESEKRVVDVALREEVIQTTGEGGGSAEMPGLDDGGEVRLLEAAAPSTVPSDGAPHRVPLFELTAPAKLERACPAELTSAVSLVARFPNNGDRVLLAGPVDLVRQSGFIGRGLLEFAAPGETLKLSFGSEDGLQVMRETEEKRDESRLTGRRTTLKTVRLHVSNARPEPARLIIEERVPVSEVKEVEIEIQTKACDPAPAPASKDGIVRIELELPPNGTRTATFVWQLGAAGKVAGV